MSAVPPIASEFCAPQGKTPSASSGREQMQQKYLRATNSINSLGRGIRNFDANLAIVAHRARMKRHEGVLIRVLRKGLACSWTSFHKARLVFENCFDELIYQIVREIGSSDHKIIHSNGNIIVVQRAVRSGDDLRGAELRHRFTHCFNLFGRKTDESDRLARLHFLDRRRRCSLRPGRPNGAVVSTVAIAVVLPVARISPKAVGRIIPKVDRVSRR
jgi:hypothetical protein